MPERERNGRITGYEVLLQPSPDRESVTGNVTGGALSVNVSGLTPNVMYNVSVRAHTAEGGGPYSSPPDSITTDQDGEHRIFTALNNNCSAKIFPIVEFSKVYTSHIVANHPAFCRILLLICLICPAVLQILLNVLLICILDFDVKRYKLVCE